LVHDPEAVGVTATVIAGKFVPAATELLYVHVAPEQYHPVPDIDVSVRAAGSVSVSVTVPLVATVPLLITVTVNAAFGWPSTNASGHQ
jgi:hypothetical protein